MVITFGKTTKNKANRLINLLFNVQNMIDNNDLSLVNKTTLENIIEKSFGKKETIYDIKFDDLDNGQYIIIEDDKIRKYIIFSYEKRNGTRNGYILTKVPIIFRNYMKDETTKEKVLEIFLLDVEESVYNKHNGTNNSYDYKDLNIENIQGSNTISPYNIFAYRLLKTCSFSIINEDNLPFATFKANSKKIKNKESSKNKLKQYTDAQIKIKKPFESVDELKTYRLSVSSTNTGNRSSYIIETDEFIVVYGKTFGNNGFEVVMIACCVAELAKKDGKKVFLYQIKDNLGIDGTENKEAKPITNENLELLKSLGIEVYDELQDYENNPEAIVDENKDSRNQIEFMKNLMSKWGTPGQEDFKKCYLCNCTIQKNIIASHIQRVCDINKLSIPFNEKRKKAIDGNNGFWLCANHDKMFEYGIITFDETTGEFVLGQDYLDSEELNQEQIDYIKEITKEKEIDAKHFTDELKDYLKIHNDRIKKENNKKKP